MLSPRLNSIIDKIPNNTIVADIGSDHGYLPIALVKNGYPRPIATEHLLGPYQQCLKSINTYNYDVDVRFGDGLAPIAPDEVDLVVIAGMSGQTIAKILGDAMDKVRKISGFIVQPMLGAETLRRFVYENSLGIKSEWVVTEGDKFYQFMWLTSDGEVFSQRLLDAYSNIDRDFLLRLGPKLLLNLEPVTKQYLTYLESKLERIYFRLNPIMHQSKHRAIHQELSQLKKVIECHTRLINASK